MPAPKEYLKNPACIDALLAKWKEDGLYYSVSLISCDKKSNKSLVKFEDGESYPIDNKDLHIQLNLDKVSDDKIICCLCEMGEENEPNVIIMCDFCQLGYHVGCHQPPIEAAFLKDADKEWYCETCLEITDHERKRKRRKSIRETPKKKDTPRKKVSPKKKESPEKKEIAKKVEFKQDHAVTEDTIAKGNVEKVAVKKVAFADAMPNKQQDAGEKHTLEKDTVKVDAAKKDTAEKGSAKKDTAEKGSAKKDTAEKESAKKDTAEKELVEEDTTEKDPVNNDKMSTVVKGESKRKQLRLKIQDKCVKKEGKQKLQSKSSEIAVQKRQQESLPDGSAIEKMDPKIIVAAKALAVADTKEFVAAM